MEIEVMRKSPYAVQFDEINCFRFAFVDIEEPFYFFLHSVNDATKNNVFGRKRSMQCNDNRKSTYYGIIMNCCHEML